MKRIEYGRTVLVCVIFVLLFLTVFSMWQVSNVIPDGQTGNPLARYLLKNVVIQTKAEDSVWAKKYPYEYTWLEKYTAKADAIKQSAESWCTLSFPESENINRLVTWGKQRLYHYDVDSISAVYENILYVRQAAQNVIDFSRALKAEGYPFLYVQTPSRESEAYYAGRTEGLQTLMILERSQAFVNALEDAGLSVISVARDHGEGIQFDCTNHWFPENGLSCAALIADRLNQDAGFAFDLRDFQLSQYLDLMDQYPQFRRQIQEDLGYNFRVPIPARDMDYTLQYAEDAVWNGDFMETLIKSDSEWILSGNIAYHNLFRVNNSLIYDIMNHSATVNQEKKILIVGDSFNWPVGAYLSMGIERVTIIHNASFTGSLMSYIKTAKPDAVLMVYNDAEFYEIYTEDAFYLF